VEGAGGAEGRHLGILGSGRASPGHGVNHNTYSMSGPVKGIFVHTHSSDPHKHWCC
jgi:hypothetical protein